MIWNLDFREKRGQRMHDKIGEYVHPWWRSGTVASGTIKTDLLSTQNGLVVRPLNRSDQDSGFHPINKRERQVALDKETPNPRTINKPSEDDSGCNIASLPKANGSAWGPDQIQGQY